MSIRTLITQWMPITASSTASLGFFPCGIDFLRAGPIEKIRAQVQIQGLEGDLDVAPAFNVANVASNPTTTGTQIGATWYTGNGNKAPTSLTDITSSTEAAQLLRPGFLGRLGTAGDPATAMVRARFDVEINDALRVMQIPWHTIWADATNSARFFPFSGYLNNPLFAKIRHVREVQPLQATTMTMALGLQKANNTSSPETPVAITSFTTTPNLQFPASFDAPSTNGYEVGRLGWLAKLTEGSTKVSAFLGGTVEYGG